MPEPGERHIAQELRGLGMGQEEIPEWKKASEGTGRVGYARKYTVPIKEQRMNLPIYKLRTELIQAITDHQVEQDPRIPDESCSSPQLCRFSSTHGLSWVFSAAHRRDRRNRLGQDNSDHTVPG